MTIETYSTHELLGVIEHLPEVNTFWLDRFYRAEQTFDSQFIDFDVVDRGRRLAPFVAPTAQGKPMLQEGYNTKRFKPAYIKPKDNVDPRRVVKRRPGEAFAGSMSAGSRRNAIIADILMEHRRMITRRWEWMGVQAIVEDQVTVSGEDYPTQIVQFGRDPNLTVTLTGANVWGDASVNILDTIEAWSEDVMQRSGHAVTDIIMGLDAWKVFRDDAKVQKALDTQIRGTQSEMEIGPGNGMAVQFRGRLSGVYRVWTYNDIYEDEAGNQQPMMDQKKVVLTNPDGLEGTRCYGAILDPRAGYVATPLWPKNFIAEDPPAEFVMSQSAPLMVPARPNAALVAKVIE